MKKRYLEYDIGRVIALCLLPLCHCYESGRTVGALSDVVLQKGNWAVHLAVLGVTCFMLCMGSNIVFSNKKEPKQFYKRALSLFLIGIALNVVRYSLPGVCAALILNNSSYYSLLWTGMLTNDILYFAALVHLFFGLCLQFKINEKNMLIVAAILHIMNSFCIVDTSKLSFASQLLLDNFYHVSDSGYFSFCQWLIVPMIGYFFAKKQIEEDHKNQLDLFWKRVGILSLIVITIDIAFIYFFHQDIRIVFGPQAFSNNYGLLSLVLNVSLCLILLSLIYRVSKVLKPSIQGFIISFSKMITVFYIISWAIITWSLVVLGLFGLTETWVFEESSYLVFSIYVFISSYFVSVLVKKKGKITK